MTISVKFPSEVLTVITALPLATPVTTPSLETVATPVALEDHETALFEALVGKTVAFNVVVFPTPTLTVSCASVTPVTATGFASPIVR